MKKGIVMEQHRRYMIMMTPDGHFEKAKKVPGSDVGQEVPYDPYPEKEWKALLFPINSFRLNYRFVAMVAAILIAIVPLYNWYDTNSAYAYVNIDINPSIEMKVNERMQVIDIVPLNDDARVIIDKLKDWRKDSVQDVTLKIIKTSEQQGYLNTDKQVMIGVSYKEAPKKDHSITKAIDESLKEQPLKEIQVATFEVPKEVHDRAEKEKVSMNKIMAENVEEKSTIVAEKDSKQVEVKQEEKKPMEIKELDENEKSIFEAFYKKAKDAREKAIPGLEKKDKLPPGLEKKQTGDKEKDKDKDTLPPGQQKKQEGKHDKHPGKAKGKDKKDQKGIDNQVSGVVKEVTDQPTNLDLPPGLLKKNKDDLENHKYWYYKEGNDTGKMENDDDNNPEETDQKDNKDHDKIPPGQLKKQEKDKEHDKDKADDHK